MKIKIFFLLSVIVMSFILSNIVVGSDFLNKASNLCGELNVKLDTAKSDKVWVNYERVPVFIGGGTVVEWVNSQLRYPVEAQKSKIEGRVYMRFVIEADGSVTNVKVVKKGSGVNITLENEAIRVVKSMPKWKPGTLWKPAIKKHIPVRCSYHLPINFKLDSVSRNKVFDQRIVDSIPEDDKVLLDSGSKKKQLNTKETELKSTKNTQKSDDRSHIFGNPLRAPVFTGEGKVTEWVASRIRYPVDAQKAKIEGRVYVKFFIEADGSVTNVEILRSPHKLLSDEAMRIVKLMPKWKPGKNIKEGKLVRVPWQMPINFYIY